VPLDRAGRTLLEVSDQGTHLGSSRYIVILANGATTAKNIHIATSCTRKLERPRRATMTRPKIFIASSRERIDWAHAMQGRLDREAEVTVWDQSVVRPSRFVIESLVEQMERTDFGIFIFAPDDLAEIQGHRYLVARDNVVLEFGMHIGRIGRQRCFMLLPRGNDVKLPSDIDGMIPIYYDDSRTDGNIEAAVSPACRSLLREIKAHGDVADSRFISTWMPENQAFRPTRQSSTLAGLWLSRFDFNALRDGKKIYGYQFDIERLDAIGRTNLVGRNIAHTSSMPHSYGHELSFAICGSFLLGSWFNLNTANFGGAQFHIASTNDRMVGLHTGNTNDNKVEPGNWAWLKICHSEQIQDVVRATNHLNLKSATVLEAKFEEWYRHGGLINPALLMQ
jgi:predicted nucleotide-binding protein